jgi:spermidine synthase
MGQANDSWYFEETSRCEGHGHAVSRVVARRSTEFQRVEIFETLGCGRCLVLDGRMQSTEADDFIYHESLVHPAMLATPSPPASILVIGGGEGATLREVLRHRSVRRAVMVDIDKQVVELCREYLPGMNGGSFDDPRTELRHEDAFGYLEDTDSSFDVVIRDLTEPRPGGPATRLYSRKFMKLIRSRLSPAGILGMQVGIAKQQEIDILATACADLRTTYATVLPYQAFVPCFGTPLGFVLATDLAVEEMASGAVDRRITERLEGVLQYWDQEAHLHSFSLPKHLRRLLNIPR